MQVIVRWLALSCFALGMATPSWADGTLTHLSGPVTLQKADGKTLPATVGAKAVTGDTVITGDKGYVRMEMTDGSEMVLRPDSQLKIEAYRFDKESPKEDKSAFSMIKGGLRTVTGLIGKRGNRDAYEMRTQTATVGIRGTQYDMRVCAGNCGALGDGTYLAVRFGAILASNPQGSLPIAAGQVGHVPPQLPPVLLPRDPGIGFTPPATIPKLDEKKKVQATQAAATPTPEQPKPTTTPDNKAAGTEKPAETKPEGKTEPSSQSATTTSSSSSASGTPSTEATPSSASGTAPAPAQAPAPADLASPLQGLSTSPSSPLTSQPSGGECTIQ